MSSRVRNDRQQQRVDQQRMQKAKDAGQTQESRQKFAKAMQQSKNETGQAKKEGEAQTGKAGSKQNAHVAMMARQGMQSQVKFASMLNSAGQASVGQGETQAKTKGDDVKENEATTREDNTKLDDKEMVAKSHVEAVDADEGRGKGGGGGAMGGGSQHSGSEGNLGGQAEGVAALGGAQEAQEAQGAQGPNAPQLPPAVLEALVKRVMVGVDAKGMGTFVVQLKDDVLSGSTIHISAKDGKISAKFTTSDKNTARLIKASEGALARALDRVGMSLASMEVEAK